MKKAKPKARKLRLAKEQKSSVAAPFWAILRKFGRRRTHRWRLNIFMRRHWRRRKLKR
jgi:ribosomal protein L39E